MNELLDRPELLDVPDAGIVEKQTQAGPNSSG